MVAKLIKSNLFQDQGIMGGAGGFYDNKRHYNRAVGSNKSTADTDYGAYLVFEQTTFAECLWAKEPQCEYALLAEGRLSHTYQDFFAHAIRRDGKGGKENSDYPGWVAWTDTPSVTGTPTSRGNFWPSSYPGEHPRLSEPLISGGAEHKARYASAQSYSTGRFSSSLKIWLQRCGCWCNNKK
jgi:hypothetical protein